MMNIIMEGTKHEKITLVVLGYIIGGATFFSATFIGHAPNNKDLAEKNFTSSEIATEAVSNENISVSTTLSAASYKDGFLRVSTSNGEFILSIKQEHVKNSGLTFAPGEQGYHYNEIPFLTSPANGFVFFCEQHSTNSESCTPYIFDTEALHTYKVQNTDGEDIAVTTANAREARFSGNILTLGTFSSLDEKMPWQVK
jgi:hypothetical protein